MTYRFSPREQWLLGLGAVVLVLFLGWTFWAEPALEEIERLDGSIARSRQELKELGSVLEEYAGLREESKNLSTRYILSDPNFSLAGRLEALIAETGLKGKVDSLRLLPAEEASGGVSRMSLEMKLSKAPLEPLLRLLYQIEYSATPLSVTRFLAAVDKGGMNVTMRVDALVKTTETPEKTQPRLKPVLRPGAGPKTPAGQDRPTGR